MALMGNNLVQKWMMCCFFTQREISACVCVFSSEPTPHFQRRLQQRVAGVRHRNVSSSIESSHLWNAVSFHRWCIHKHTLLSALFTPVGLTRGRFTSSVTALTSCNMTCWSFLLWMFLNTEFCPVWILQVHRQGTSWLADPQQCGGAHIRTKFAHWGETRDPVTVNKCALYNQN